MGTEATTLAPMGTNIPAEDFDKIETRYGMYVPWKYLPMLLETELTPKEALCKVAMEATSQGDSSILKPLIDWLCVAITRSDMAETSLSLVAWASLPEIALIEPQLLQGQLKVVKTDLIAWYNFDRGTWDRGGNSEERLGKLIDILHK
jgi:hypothetical protein